MANEEYFRVDDDNNPIVYFRFHDDNNHHKING